jgi:hypothetical protein
MITPLDVRGGASEEELAAVLAALAALPTVTYATPTDATSTDSRARYLLWRATRLAALSRDIRDS